MCYYEYKSALVLSCSLAVSTLHIQKNLSLAAASFVSYELAGNV